MTSRATLIIGKNARLVQAIAPRLKTHDSISHDEVNATDLARYQDIFVFSWDFRSPRSNLDLLAKLPAEKVILISTIAVWSLQLRNQWNEYPNAKSLAEEFVLGRGGRVLRIGVTDRELLYKLSGAVPFSSAEDIATAINEWSDSRPPIVEVFAIRVGRLSGIARVVTALINSLSAVLPARKCCQAPLQVVAKALGIRQAGYTADALRFCSEEIMIGYGALGSSYDRAHPSSSRRILVSGMPNETLEGNGFVHTTIGRRLIGLSALWHGVSTEQSAAHRDKATKKVPLIVARPRPPAQQTSVAHVEKIEFDDAAERWVVRGATRDGALQVFYSKRLILAAGPIENARLLMWSQASRARFSDHEIAMVGSCPVRCAEMAQGVRRLGPILVRGYSHLCEAGDQSFLIEFRPYVASKHGRAGKDATFYMTSTRGVLKRLARDLSLARINEAVFNKFGFAFATERCSVFVQAVGRDCIAMDVSRAGTCSLSRTRISDKEWSRIIERSKGIVSDIAPVGEVVSVDAQHIMGGGEILNDPSIAKLIAAGRLVVAGSPTNERLSAVHHTPALQRQVASL